jgi:hypothetical protein
LALAIGASSATMAMESVEIRMGSYLRVQVELARRTRRKRRVQNKALPNTDVKTSKVYRML